MSAQNSLPPSIKTEIPGPRSQRLSKRLSKVETHDVTCLNPPPIFWQKSLGANIWDVDGNRFIDLSAAFGVANVGHSHPDVVAAAERESRELLHGMGDVYPSESKVALLEKLTSHFPTGGKSRTPLSSSGSDAVETAIKTSILKTGRSSILAFEGAYHGLSLGTLPVTHNIKFRKPFESRLPRSTHFARFDDINHVEATMAAMNEKPAAILVEPVQGRGGENVPQPGFLPFLRDLCDKHEVLLIADEIYTGFGRTGTFFACNREEIVPDLLCLGKGMSSGMPISACIGRESVMNSWPKSKGEPLHTQTFLGHPPGCSAALASIEIIEKMNLSLRAKELGNKALNFLCERLTENSKVSEVRGLGLMIGIECTNSSTAQATVQECLRRGIILLPSGEKGTVLSITPPLNISSEILSFALTTIVESLEDQQ